MSSYNLSGTKVGITSWLFVLVFSTLAWAQGPKPPVKPAGSTVPQASSVKVALVDEVALRKVIVPKDKPLLVNFWATWCDPCREEFPDLVKFDAEYKGKIDFITVSLDDPADILTTVPRFLSEMKATMPAYLLKTADESAVIASISTEWQGGMPFTILFNPKGETTYFRQGKVILETLRKEIDKLLGGGQASSNDLYITADFVKIKDGRRDEAIFFYENNWKVYRDAAMKSGLIHSYELIEAKSEKHVEFDLVLVTRYKGEGLYKNSEKNFEPLLKEIRPSGPMLKNAMKPEEFRQNVFLYTGRSVFISGN
ncbi:MAG: TlpA family protein disulfide reductase [Blastocatellia bacterium]